jgi:hypothetical protein
LSYISGQTSTEEIFGKVSQYQIPFDLREISQISSSKFSGLEFLGCKTYLRNKFNGEIAWGIKDTYVLDNNEVINAIPYYLTINGFKDALYNVQCCGRNRYVDVWRLGCPMDPVAKVRSNYYGMEFRMARKRTMSDKSYVICPIKRSACKYNDATGETISCGIVEKQYDKTYLVGYNLTIWVEEYSSNFFYWRGVSKCEVESIERLTPLRVNERFNETIYMIHQPKFQPDASSAFFFLLTLLVLAYPLLYYCRRQTCSVCTKKLIFFFDRCYMCRFVGAYPTDPTLIKALEEKSEHIQGEYPDRLPSSRRIIRCLQGNYIVRVWNYITCKHSRAVAAQEMLKVQVIWIHTLIF